MADLVDAAGGGGARPPRAPPPGRGGVPAPLGALARVRGGKPMHPRGVVFDARLTRTGPAHPWGLSWIGGRGGADVLVRISRGAGLPPRFPDLLGLAVRLPATAPGVDPIDLL